MRAAGIVGVAFNLPFHGVPYYLGAEALLARLAELDMILQLQVQNTDLLEFLPLIEKYPVRLLIDHCGRPDIAAGPRGEAFQALLTLGQTGRAAVKLSGHIKFSHTSYPFQDTWPFIQALVDAFTPDNCVWGSDWPFLRAPERVDYGPLLRLLEYLLPDAADRRKVLWHTPRRLFGFGGTDNMCA
ncbi:hypothetical protein GCM10010909_08230 [Acidocella aquatica]|uniref:Amidohydrolase-related domain-containing protein n=1 Tax=Acidocella aquatica TaxID=1922313 RepID=A0ABQ6A127_9PROT|nr:amidohydrolase family protein [Acidocella aquatica]GLR66144.1 hypothetical protein GCM10010909_08230 [Acidocella aquatica]